MNIEYEEQEGRVSKYEVFSGPYFFYSYWIQEKYEPDLGTFHAEQEGRIKVTAKI